MEVRRKEKKKEEEEEVVVILVAVTTLGYVHLKFEVCLQCNFLFFNAHDSAELLQLLDAKNGSFRQM